MPDFLLSPKQYQAIKWLQDAHTEELFFGGGAGSGKSLFGCYWHIKNRIKYPQTRGVIGRAKLSVLKDSTLVTFFKVCSLLELKAGVHYRYNENKSKIFWYNGSTTILLDMFFYPSDPDFNRFGSTEYTDAFIDEAPEITQKAFEILNSRLRWKIVEYGIVPKMLLTGNPGPTWIKYYFVKDRDGNWINLQSHQKRMLATVMDNPDKNFVRVYMSKLEKLSEYDRSRLLHGDWDAVPRTGSEYYFPFNHKIHVKKNTYDPALKLHLMFDFNVNPFMTLLVFQIAYTKSTGRYDVRGLCEFCLAHPRNSTRAVCEAFKADERFRHHMIKLFYYGDFTGKTRNTLGIAEAQHNFQIVDTQLKYYLNESSDRVIPNQSVLLRKDFMIDILNGKTNIDFSLDESMIRTRDEFLYMKEDVGGHKFVERTMNPDTKISYEKWGHPTDALEYFLTSAFWTIFQNYKKRHSSY